MKLYRYVFPESVAGIMISTIHLLANDREEADELIIAYLRKVMGNDVVKIAPEKLVSISEVKVAKLTPGIVDWAWMNWE